MTFLRTNADYIRSDCTCIRCGSRTIAWRSSSNEPRDWVCSDCLRRDYDWAWRQNDFEGRDDSGVSPW